MVQTRQLRKSHPDSHYAAAIFQYQREMAVRLKPHSIFVSLDDKHRVSVGEPGYPVATVERGKQVLVACNQDFLVADHDLLSSVWYPLLHSSLTSLKRSQNHGTEVT